MFSGGTLLAAWQRLEGLSDDTFKNVQEKTHRYREAKAALGMRQRLADAWCAAFVVTKTPAALSGFRGITTGTLRTLAAGKNLDARAARMIDDAAARLRFVHPQLAFPDVFANGGFDVVLGNPPWERVKLQEKEFFAERDPRIAAAANKAERERLITGLRGTPLHAEYLQAKRDAAASSAMLRKSGRFPLCGRGDVNTYAVFAELTRYLLGPRGRAGVIVPTGIATDDTTKFFFQDLVEKGALHSYYGFKNERFLFPKPVEHTVTYGLLTMVGAGLKMESMEFAWLCWTVDDLRLPERRHTLTADDIRLMNPNTRTCPVFRTRRDAKITKAIYRRVPVLLREGDPGGNGWGIRLSAMLHMSSDSGLFRTAEELESAGARLGGNEFTLATGTTMPDGRDVDPGAWLPLYEAKMVHHFDHRWATHGTVLVAKGKKAAGDLEARDVTDAEKADPAFVVQPRYWVHEDEVNQRARIGAPEELWEAFQQCNESEARCRTLYWALGAMLANSEADSPQWLELYEEAARLCQVGGPSGGSNLAVHLLRLGQEYPLTGAEVQSLLDCYRQPTWSWAGLARVLGSRAALWFIGFRDICRSTDVRSAIFAILPRSAVGNNLPLMFPDVRSVLLRVGLSTNLSMFVFDFVARQSIGGAHLNFFIVQQLPALSPAIYSASTPWCGGTPLAAWIAPRVLELTYTAHDQAPFARDLGYEGERFSWNSSRRFWLRAELDAAFFHLYGVARDDVDYILDTFHVIKQDDEKTHRCYRTKEGILEVYDAMAEAIRTGTPYKTRLDPPPANGWTPPPLPPLEELMPKAGSSGSPGPSADRSGKHPATVSARHTAAIVSEPDELLLTPPAPRALRGKDGQEMRVRVYSASDEVLLQRGLAVSRLKNGDCTVWSVIPDGETAPRDFQSPPCVVKRLKPKR